MRYKGRRAWTEEDKALVRSSYMELGPAEIGRRLGRATSNVASMARYLGVAHMQKGGYRGRKKPVTPQPTTYERNHHLTAMADKVRDSLRANPPGLVCWLKGGVNVERAQAIAREIEERPKKVTFQIGAEGHRDVFFP